MCASRQISKYLHGPLPLIHPRLSLVLVVVLLLLSFPAGVGAQWLGQMLRSGPFFGVSGELLRLESGPATAGDGADITRGDMDGDGLPDLLAGSAYGDLVYYRQLPDGSWDSPQALVEQNTQIWRWPPIQRQASPELVDWDGDGKLDLLLGYGARLFWYQRRGLKLGVARPIELADGRPVAEVIRATSPLAGHLAPHAADFDGDGDIDLLLGDDEGRIWWVENQGTSASPSLLVPQLLGTAGGPVQVAGRARVCVGDYDADGCQDLIIGDRAGDLWWCPGTTEGLDEPRRIEIEFASEGLCPYFIGASRELWLGDADGFISRATISASAHLRWQGYLIAAQVPLDVGRAAAVCALDWDADGDLDLVVGNAAGEVIMYERVGGESSTLLAAGRSISTATGPLVAAAGYAWPRLADFDGDGDMDIFLGTGAGTIELWRNSGQFVSAGSLRVADRQILTSGPATVAACDYDQDGDTDLFVGGKSFSGGTRPAGAIPPGRVAYFENAANRHRALPVFNKGTLVDMYIAKSAAAEADVDARVLIPHLAEPVGGNRQPDFIVTAEAGIFLLGTIYPRSGYPFLRSLPTPAQLPAPLLPGAYSAYLCDFYRTGQPVLLCGTDQYGMVCAYDAGQLGIIP